MVGEIRLHHAGNAMYLHSTKQLMCPIKNIKILPVLIILWQNWCIIQVVILFH